MYIYYGLLYGVFTSSNSLRFVFSLFSHYSKSCSITFQLTVSLTTINNTEYLILGYIIRIGNKTDVGNGKYCCDTEKQKGFHSTNTKETIRHWHFILEIS